AVETLRAQAEVYRDDEQEIDADGRQLAEAGHLVQTVRVDDGDGPGQVRLSQMELDHDHLDALPGGLYQGREGERAAIDRDDDLHAFGRESAERRRIGAVALLQAIGNVDA